MSYKLARHSKVVALAATVAVGAMGVNACTVGGKAGETTSGGNTGTVTITLWNNLPAVDAVKKISAGFEKEHRGVHVDVKYAPNPNNAYNTLVSGLLAAKSVDIVGRYPETPDAYPPASTGIKPVGEAARIAAGQDTNLKDQPFMSRLDVAQQIYAAGYKGGIYGLLADQFAAYPCVFYKKAMFAKYHLTIPNTFSQLMTVFRKFQKNKVTPLLVPAKDGYQDFIRNAIVDRSLMQGRPSADAEQVGVQRSQAFWSGKQSWNDPFYRQVYGQYVKIMQYAEKNAAGVASATAVGSWAANTHDYPMYVTGSWDGPTIQKANPALDYGFFCLPTSDTSSDNRLILSPDLVWTVPKYAPHKKLALEWLDYFTKRSNYQTWLKLTGAYPTVTGTQPATAKWTDWLGQHGKGAFEHITGPWIPNGAPTDAAGPDELNMIPLGSESVNAALGKAAADYARARGTR